MAFRNPYQRTDAPPSDPLDAARAGYGPMEGGYSGVTADEDPALRAAAARSLTALPAENAGIPEGRSGWGEYSLAENLIALPGDTALEAGLETAAARTGELMYGATRIPQTVAEGVGAGEWWQENAPELREYINEKGIKPVFGDRKLVDQEYKNNTWQGIKDKVDEGDLVGAGLRLPGFVLKEGVGSIPDMVALLTGPVGLGLYGATRTSEIAEGREESGGETNTAKDVGIAAATTVAVTALDRFGLGKLINRTKLGGTVAKAQEHWAKRIGIAAGTEASTEAVQEHLEYVGEMVRDDFSDVIEQATDPAAMEAALVGAIVGGGVGAGVVAGGDALQSYLDKPKVTNGPAEDEVAAVDGALSDAELEEQSFQPALPAVGMPLDVDLEQPDLFDPDRDEMGPALNPSPPPAGEPLPLPEQLPEEGLPLFDGPLPPELEALDDELSPRNPTQTGEEDEDQVPGSAVPDPSQVVYDEDGAMTDVVALPNDPVELTEDDDPEAIAKEVAKQAALENNLTASGQRLTNTALGSFLKVAGRGGATSMDSTAIESGKRDAQTQAASQQDKLKNIKNSSPAAVMNRLLDNSARYFAAQSRKNEEDATAILNEQIGNRNAGLPLDPNQMQEYKQLRNKSSALLSVARQLAKAETDMKKFMSNETDSPSLARMVGVTSLNLRLLQKQGVESAINALATARVQSPGGKPATTGSMADMRRALDNLNKELNAELQSLDAANFDTSKAKSLPATRDQERAVSPSARRAQEYIADSQRVSTYRKPARKGNVDTIIDEAMLPGRVNEDGVTVYDDPSPRGSEEREERKRVKQQQQDAQGRLQPEGYYTDYTRPGPQYRGIRDEGGKQTTRSQRVVKRTPDVIGETGTDAQRVARLEEQVEDLLEQKREAKNKGAKAKLTSRINDLRARIFKIERGGDYAGSVTAAQEAKALTSKAEELESERRAKNQPVSGIRGSSARAPGSSKRKKARENEKRRARLKKEGLTQREIDLDAERKAQAVRDALAAEENARLLKETERAVPDIVDDIEDTGTTRAAIGTETNNKSAPMTSIVGSSDSRRARAAQVLKEYIQRHEQTGLGPSPAEIQARILMAKKSKVGAKGLGTLYVFNPAEYADSKNMDRALTLINGGYPKITKVERDARGHIKNIERAKPKSVKTIKGYYGESDKEYFSPDEVEVVVGKRVESLDIRPNGKIETVRKDIRPTQTVIRPEEMDSLLRYIGKLDLRWRYADDAVLAKGENPVIKSGPDERALVDLVMNMDNRTKKKPASGSTPGEPEVTDDQDTPDGPPTLTMEDLDDLFPQGPTRPSQEDQRRGQLKEKIAELEDIAERAEALKPDFLELVDTLVLDDTDVLTASPPDGWPFNLPYSAKYKDGFVGVPMFVDMGQQAFLTPVEDNQPVDVAAQNEIKKQIDGHIDANAASLADARSELEKLNESGTGKPTSPPSPNKPKAGPDNGPARPRAPAGAGDGPTVDAGVPGYIRVDPRERKATDLLAGIGPDGAELSDILDRVGTYRVERDGLMTLDEAQMVGIAKSYRMWLLSKERNRAGFANFDGTGFGKTRQIVTAADMITTDEEANGTMRPVLLMTKGSSDPSNKLIVKTKADMRLLGIDPDAKYSNGKPRFVMTSHSHLELKDTTEYAGVFVDEMHAVKGLNAWGKGLDGLNTKFRALYTATPTDNYGQEAYFLKHVHPTFAQMDLETAVLQIQGGMFLDLTQEEKGSGKRKVKYKPAPGNTEAKYIEKLEQLVRESAADGAVVSRTKGRIAINDGVAVPQEAIPAEYQARYDELVASNASTAHLQTMVEYMKLPFMVEQAKKNIADGQKIIAVFKSSSVPAPLQDMFTDPPLVMFTKALNDAGIKGSFYYGSTESTAPSNAIEGFQPEPKEGQPLIDGEDMFLAVTDSKASTGLDLNDFYGQGHARRLMVAMSSEEGLAILQVIGRHDRTNNVSVPYTTMVRIEGNQTDINYRTAIDRKIKLQNAAIGFRTGREANADLKKPQINEDPGFKLRQAELSLKAKKDTTDHAVLDAISGKGDTARKALLTIAENSEVPLFKELAASLLNVNLPTMSLKTRIMPEEEHRKLAAFGMYDPKPRELAIYPHPGATQTFLHELVHHFTILTLARNPEARAQVRALMVAAGRSPRVTSRFENAFQDEYEFVSEAFTDEQLQKLLMNTYLKNNKRLSLWDRFVRWVKNAVGINTDTTTALDQVMQLNLFADPDVVPLDQVQPTSAPLARVAQRAEEMDRRMRVGNVSKNDVTKKGLVAQLRAMTFNQIVDVYKKYAVRRVEGGKPGGNPLEELLEAMELTEAAAHKHNNTYQSRVLKRFRDFSTGAGKEMISVRMREDGPVQDMTVLEYLTELMNISGYAKVHFGKDTGAPENKMWSHSADAKAAWKLHKKNTRLRKMKEAMAVYNDLAKYFDEQKNVKQNLFGGMYLDTVYPNAPVKWVDRPSKVRAKLAELRNTSEKELKDLGTSKQALDQLRDIIKPGTVPGAYFPLYRYGDWVIVADGELDYNSDEERDTLLRKYPMGRDNPKENVIKLKTVARFESAAEAQTFKEQLEAENRELVTERYLKVSDPMVRAEENYASLGEGSSFSGLMSSFSSTVDKRVREKGTDGAEAERLKKTFALTLLDMMPESSAIQSMQSRKGTSGASKDMQRTLTSYGASQGFMLANMQYSRRKADLMDDLRMEARDRDKMGGYQGFVLEVVRQELMSRMARAEASTMELGNLAQIASDVGFAYYLVGASYNLINATQVPLLTYPHLAARFGPARAAKALGRAYKLAGTPVAKELLSTGGSLTQMRGLFQTRKNRKDFDREAYDIVNKDGGLLDSLSDPNHVKLINNMLEFGDIDVTLAADMGRTSARAHVDQQGRPVSQSWGSYLTDWMRTAPHLTEVANRSVTALAAFDLMYEKTGNFDEAQKFARSTVKQTQFVYANWNKPPVFQHPAGRVALMFKMHVQGMYYHMISNVAKSVSSITDPEEKAAARKELGMFIMMHVAAAGMIGGTPELIKWILNLGFWALSDDDEPIEYDKWMRNLMYDNFGQAGATFASQGLPGFLGMDLSGRVGIDSMLMYEGPDLSDKDAFARSMLELAGGPMASLGLRLPDAVSRIRNRQFDRLLETALPKALKDPLVAVRHKTEGFQDLSGKTYYDAENMSWRDFGQQVLGFTPKRTSDAYATRGVGRTRTRMEAKRRVYFTRFYEAKSGKERDRVYADVAKWNADNPQFRIDVGQLWKSYTQRKRQELLTRKGNYVPNAKRAWADERLRSYTE